MATTRGLASSDENGRNAPSVDRFFDGIYMSFDENGQPVFGDLATDRPHQFEVQASYQFPWGTDIGAYYLIGTGLPQSQTVTVRRAGVQPRARHARADADAQPVRSTSSRRLGCLAEPASRWRRTSSICSIRTRRSR